MGDLGGPGHTVSPNHQSINEPQNRENNIHIQFCLVETGKQQNISCPYVYGITHYAYPGSRNHVRYTMWHIREVHFTTKNIFKTLPNAKSR